MEKGILEPGLTASCRPSDPAPKPGLISRTGWNQNLNFYFQKLDQKQTRASSILQGTGTGTI